MQMILHYWLVKTTWCILFGNTIFRESRIIYTELYLYLSLLETTDKTKEIIFHRPASRHLNIPPLMPDVERFTQATLLGIDFDSRL